MIRHRLIIFSTILLSTAIRVIYSVELVKDPGSTGCHEEEYRVILCQGNNIKISGFLANVPPKDSPSTFYFPRFERLQIYDTNMTFIDEHTIDFHGYEFEVILIVNAPNLKYIHPKAFITFKDTLEDFRAINTSLPNYNDVGGLNDTINPFDGFSKLLEVFVSNEDSHCPPPELIDQCTCKFGGLGRKKPSGLYGFTWGYRDGFPNRTELHCNIQANFTVENMKLMFQQLNQSTIFFPKRFDVLHLYGGEELTNLPEDLFSSITFTTIWMSKMSSLNTIHQSVFGKASKTIQILDIDGGNFTDANDKGVDNIFEALSSLVNVRILRLSSVGIPYVPSFGFEGKMENFHSLSISFDRREHKSGLRSIGSYAFSGASNLRRLGLLHNFIEKFEPYAFGFNESNSNSLKIDIGTNPFNDETGLAPNAWSGAKRPLKIVYEIDNFAASDPANDPSFNYFPESVFRPFLEENKQNSLTIDYFNIEIWCDHNSSWLFDLDSGLLKDRVKEGVKVRRVTGNVVSSEPDSSIQCKPASTFKGLPHCLGFPVDGLIHCGGEAGENFNLRENLRKFICLRKNFTSVIFSTKNVNEFPSGVLEDFQLERIAFKDSTNLTIIHPNAFGSLTPNSLKEITFTGTNVKTYPHFGMFSNLTRISLDDTIPYHLQAFNFDYTGRPLIQSFNPIIMSMDYGTIDPDTFSKLGNQTNVGIILGKQRDCSTIACTYQCLPSAMVLEKLSFKPFLESNPKNKITTSCYVNCSCKLGWLYHDWNKFQENEQIQIFHGGNYAQEFYCIDPNPALHENNKGNNNSSVSDEDEEIEKTFGFLATPKGLMEVKTYLNTNCQENN